MTRPAFDRDDSGRASAAGRPRVSVVIPAFNLGTVIGDCLASLVRAEEVRSGDVEIVVSDDGSTDRTAEIVRRFPVRYVRGPQGGCAVARNRGIAASRGEVMAFLDADCVAGSAWLAELLRPFEDPGIDAATGEVVAYPPRTPTERYVARRRPRFEHWPGAASLPWFTTNNSAIRREVFERIGTFDPRASKIGCEDIDFSWRFFGAGLRLARRSRAVVFHRHPSTVAGLFRQQVRNGRAQAWLLAKHEGVLRWGWRRELAAWADLGEGIRNIVQSVARAPGPGVFPELEEALIDLVRKAAQRVGFVKGLALEARRARP